jgi:alpha-tubulin suppressor-like RCC1 family protein
MRLRVGVIAVSIAASACLSEPPRPSGQLDAPGPPPTGPGWSSITAGTLHSCGIRVDGTLWCWGRNDSGQIGTSSSDSEDDVPVQIGSGTWSAVSAGGIHTCAIDTDQQLWCWGDDGLGELGIGSNGGPMFQPAQVDGTWLAVSSGQFHTCGIKTDASIWCWGDNSVGELGDGSDAGSNVPTAIVETSAPTEWHDVAAADDFTCAIGADQSMWCWGTDVYGSLGDSGGTIVFAPVPSGSAGDRWDQLAAGGETACGVLVDGGMKCWGEGTSGQLGNDTTSSSNVPVAVGHGETWKSVAVGFDFACGIESNNGLYCWGANAMGQLGATTPEMFESSPVMVASGSDAWLAVAGGAAHTCAIDSTSALWCAGLDGGQLGSADGGSRTTPVQVSGTSIQIAVGGDITGGYGETACSIDDHKAVSCWGFNGFGAVGDGTTIDRDVPTSIMVGSGGVESISVSDHVCAIDITSNLYCWGYNEEGGVGDSTMTDRASPVNITGLWSSVATSRHTCAIPLAGDTECWGYNPVGETGQTGGPNTLSPADTSHGYTSIGVGDAHSCGIASGQVMCWGDSTFGELGTEGMSGGPTPVTVTGLSADTLVVGGADTCGAMGTTFSCCGKNDHGQLGNQTATLGGTATPSQLPGTWDQIAIGENHACGVMVGGTLACWGANNFGQLGLGSFVEYHEPQAVGTSTWTNVAVGVDDTCAISASGALYCWGRNLEGEVGDGAAWRSTFLPVQ